MNVTPINKNEEVSGLSPFPIPAELIAKPTHLQCGACGFNGTVTHYVFTNAVWCFDAVCDCPIPAVLEA